MRSRRMFAGVTLLLAAVAGCQSLARQVFANPVVEVKDVRVKGFGLQGGSLDVILDVYNPNEYRLDATGITYHFWIDSTTELATRPVFSPNGKLSWIGGEAKQGTQRV